MSASMSSLQQPSTVTVPYKIAGCSEHSGNYVAENIMVDRPHDQSSRWSGAQQPPSMKQWMLLRLETLSVVKSITFGKFHRKHPCNMKEFKIYLGLNPDHMIQVLHAGLKDDTIPETFYIPHLNKDKVPFATRFVKIVPLSAHGQSFHISIWYVSVSGITESSFVERVRLRYDEHRETVVLRQVLKHLRERRLLTPYQSILSRSGIQLEHPIVTSLHTNLVLQGKWVEAEALLSQASDVGLFGDYLQSCQPHAQWKRLHGVDADGDAPTKRGGHAMCLDPDNSHIYLFGGWDGSKSLDDFWVYDIATERWRLISHSTAQEKNGPVARSCHKMVFDAKSACIYLLGRLGDGDPLKPVDEVALRQAGEQSGGESSRPVVYCSEFYRYHTRGLDAGKWDLLSFDTASSNGPPLICDHQMVMDSEAQMLYAFGGRVVDANCELDSQRYSGFYSYNIRTSKWKLIQPLQASLAQQPILPRYGHSMVLDPNTHTLFIFAGQRDDKYLSDMYVYDIQRNTVTELFANFTSSGGPDACFTQRAIIDPGLKEIYVFCGLTRAQQSSALTVLRSDTPNWVYRYEDPLLAGKWTQILPEVPSETGETCEVPVPRYAHQVVYDEGTKRVFMHGGNAGETRDVEAEAEKENDEGDVGYGSGSADEERPRTKSKEMRLDDFWSMSLLRAAPEQVIRQGKYLIRRQRFREMCEEQPAVKALRYLQTDVSEVVDHDNPEETSVFRSLLAHLVSPTSSMIIDHPPLESFKSAHVPDEPPPQKRSRSNTSEEAWTKLSSASSMVVDDPPLESSQSDHVPDEPPLPAKKRSRSNTPDEAWTSTIEEDDDMASESSVPLISSTQKRRHAVFLMDEDPEEATLRDGATKRLSAERFKQRTEVFESLLAFVGDDSKQPKGSLLDLVDTEDGL